MVSLNGRPQAPLIDPDVDISPSHSRLESRAVGSFPCRPTRLSN